MGNDKDFMDKIKIDISYVQIQKMKKEFIKNCKRNIELSLKSGFSIQEIRAPVKISAGCDPV